MFGESKYTKEASKKYISLKNVITTLVGEKFIEMYLKYIY